MAVKIVGKFERNYQNFKKAFKRTLQEFGSCSTIHGLKYVCDPDRNWMVRCVWLIITILMLCCGIIIIVISYSEFRSNLTRMNIEDENAPTNLLMFPAVTVCISRTSNTWKWKEMVQTLKLPPKLSVDEANNLINLMEHFLERRPDDSSLAGVEEMEEIMLLNNLTLMDIVEKTRWQCSDYMVRCRLNAGLVDCQSIFQLAKTSIGFCCAFNIIQNGLNFTAKRADATLLRGLTLALEVNDTENQDYEIMIGENNAFPNRRLPLSFASNNEISFISISPSKIISSARLKSLSIEERNCVLEDEIELEYFDKYLSNHCYMNCMVKIVNETCGCVLYQFTISPSSLKTRICSFKDLNCIITRVKSFDDDTCNCLPTCETIKYRTAISSAPFYLQESNVDEFYKGLTRRSSVVNIYISQEIYQVLLHDLLSDMLTLVCKYTFLICGFSSLDLALFTANLGSSFSLFLGMSMISVLEIIYYFTIVLRKNYIQESVEQKKLLFLKNKKLTKIKSETKLKLNQRNVSN